MFNKFGLRHTIFSPCSGLSQRSGILHQENSKLHYFLFQKFDKGEIIVDSNISIKTSLNMFAVKSLKNDLYFTHFTIFYNNNNFNDHLELNLKS